VRAPTLAAGLCLGVLGCDAGERAAPAVTERDAAPPRDFASGSRLRARYHRVDDLVDVLVGFHDAMLAVDCAFADEQGGHLGPGATAYCLPDGMARHREGSGPYLDGQCTEAVGVAPPSGGAGAFAVVQPRDACTRAPVVYAARSAELRRVYVKEASGLCVLGDRIVVQPFGDRVPEGTFVRATEVAEVSPARIGARVLVAEDGARVVVGGYDRVRGEAVRVGDAGDGEARWVPSRVAFRGTGELLFGDATCAQPVATKIARTATCPLSGAVVLEGACGGGTYHALGEPLAAAFGVSASGACVRAESSATFVVALGEAVPASAFSVATVVDVGGARVRRRSTRGDGPEAVTWTEIVDVATSEACVVAPATDGTLRCLPGAAEVVNLYAEDTCASPAFAHPLTGCEGGRFARVVRDALDTPARAFEATGDLAVAFTRDPSGRCTRFTPAVPSRLFAARELPPSRFPPATTHRD